MNGVHDMGGLQCFGPVRTLADLVPALYSASAGVERVVESDAEARRTVAVALVGAHDAHLIDAVDEALAAALLEEFATEIRDIIIEGVNLEVAFNGDLFPRGILGLNADYVNQYVQYVADRRLEELGLGKHYNVSNPAKWMSTATDVFELVNFFEAQNTSYEVDSGSKHK